jgi:hypothetical protein
MTSGWASYFSPLLGTSIQQISNYSVSPISRVSTVAAVSPISHVASTVPVESSDAFKIVMILDESGSMDCIRNDMIKAINNLLTEQKQIKDRPCRFTLVKFNDKIERLLKNIDLADTPMINTMNYTPQRTTALYDAIGSTIDWFRYEKDVLMVIVTDGQENASQKYTKDQVTEMLDEKQKNRGWSYVYLSNDLKTAAQGDSLGLKKSKWSSNQIIDQSQFGDYCSKTLNNAISNFRKDGISVQEQLNNDIYTTRSTQSTPIPSSVTTTVTKTTHRYL